MSHVSWRRQLILALILFVLGTGAFWLEYKHKPESEAIEEQAKKVFKLKDTPVSSIELQAGNQVVLNCADLAAKLCKPADNSKWEITVPVKLKADDANVNSLLSSLNNLSSNETIDLKDETPEKRAALLKEYGLDALARGSSATKKVIVSVPGGKTVLYMGQPHPISESTFALVEHVSPNQQPGGNIDETRVYLVPNYFNANLTHDLTYWRDKKLMSLAAKDVESFQLDDTKAHLKGERKAGQWTLTLKNGDEIPGDPDNVDNLVTAATFLSAKTFVSDNKTDVRAKAALKGAHPVITLTLQRTPVDAKQAPAPVTLEILEKGGKGAKGKSAPTTLLATVSDMDPLYELEPAVKDRLDKDVKDLRMSKLITSMERFTAKKLAFSGKPMGASPLTLANDNGKWVSEPDKTEVSNEKVQALLDKLSGNRIQEFLAGSALPAGEDSGLHLTLGDEKDPAKRQYAFWKSGDKLYARDLLTKKNEGFTIDRAVQDNLPWDRNFFKKEPAPAGTKKK